MEPNPSVTVTRPAVLPPAWVPDAVRRYLTHTEEGLSLRELARREGLAASTVLRQVRRYEVRRDDPLVDEALAALAGSVCSHAPDREDRPDMTAPIRPTPVTPGSLDEAGIAREGRRILRRMAEPGAVMAVAPDMDKAAVLRQAEDGRMIQTAVLDRAVAQAFALKDWILCRRPGRPATYEITPLGRAALKRLIEEEDRRRLAHHAALGLAEAPVGFALPAGWEDGEGRRNRAALQESPVSVLARRRDKDGQVFLGAELVRAAERLHEDYELAQINMRGTSDWEGFVRGAGRPVGAPLTARDRVAVALADLGPGLGDVALRVCCYQEGLEVAERRMGWAARSGKIVLRIALQRLRRHYDETYGRAGPLIG